MKARHKESARLNALATLELANAHVGQDFYTLRASQVDVILAAADRVGYKAPKNANGSRARYFYELLQRRAR